MSEYKPPQILSDLSFGSSVYRLKKIRSGFPPHTESIVVEEQIKDLDGLISLQLKEIDSLLSDLILEYVKRIENG